MVKLIKRDPLAFLYGVAFTFLSVIVPQGPDLGAAIVLLLFISTGGWLTATALVDCLALRYRQGTKRKKKILLGLRAGAVIISVIILVSYFLFLRVKSVYSLSEIAIYLFIVFIFSILIRTAIYSGNMAKRNAEQRASGRKLSNNGRE